MSGIVTTGTAGTPVSSDWYVDNDGDGFGDVSDTQNAVTKPSGYVEDDTDCNDADDTINPNASEVYDSVDNNCDGSIDEDFVEYFQDSDGDSYGNVSVSQWSAIQLANYVVDSTDCNDSNSAVNPAAIEIYDSIDNDCDNDVDENFSLYHQDSDGDSFGNISVSQWAIIQPVNYVVDNTDCNDSDGAVNPAAIEIYDSIDNDCDDDIDEGFTIYYQDLDGDSHGNAAVSHGSKIQPLGWVINDTDCDDSESLANPSQLEIYDSIDNDCDGDIDEGYTVYYQDLDSDSYGNADESQGAKVQPLGWVADNTDCDDGNEDINPGKDELADRIDQNCDGKVDDGISYMFTTEKTYNTNLGDLTGADALCQSHADEPSSQVPTGIYRAWLSNSIVSARSRFQNSTNSFVRYHGVNGVETIAADWATLVSGDDLLNNLDVDEHGNPTTQAGFSWTGTHFNGNRSGADFCGEWSETTCTPVFGKIDQLDGDWTHITSSNTASKKHLYCIRKTAQLQLTYWFKDFDGDGYGDVSDYREGDQPDSTWVADANDCDDTMAAINPAAIEVYDSADNNCDGQIDEDFQIYYQDLDSDSYGNLAVNQIVASQPAGYVTDNTDCDDSIDTGFTINPAATEINDGSDNNCDGDIDEGFYVLGGTGPAGGIVFIIEANAQHGYEAAPSNQGSGVAWGCYGEIIAGADSVVVGSGAQNTADILADCTQDGTAAKIADAYSLNSYSDWFLPSINELYEFYTVVRDYGVPGVPGGLSLYWSSTEVDTETARCMLRKDGDLGSCDRGSPASNYKVRAVRTF